MARAKVLAPNVPELGCWLFQLLSGSLGTSLSLSVPHLTHLPSGDNSAFLAKCNEGNESYQHRAEIQWTVDATGVRPPSCSHPPINCFPFRWTVVIAQQKPSHIESYGPGHQELCQLDTQTANYLVDLNISAGKGKYLWSTLSWIKTIR